MVWSGCNSSGECESSCWMMRSGASKVAPHGSMVAVQAITAGYFVLTNQILVTGISSTVLLVYQYILATIFMALLALVFERKNRPPLTLRAFLWIFLLAFVGITLAQNLLAACMYFISSTVDTAVLNMVPVFTYILSVISREEKLEINTVWGKGKLLGTLICVSGALTLMSWRGSSLLGTTESTGYWILGLAMAVLGILSFSSWILMLRPMVRIYPAEFSLTALMFLCAALQTGVLAAFESHKASEWTLTWNLELLVIVFGGVLNSGIANLLYTWCASVKGPVFVATFSPLTYVFTTIMETAFLGSSLYLGSIIGSIIIVVGLYIYLWSKAKEEKSCEDESINSPLLV